MNLSAKIRTHNLYIPVTFSHFRHAHILTYKLHASPVKVPYQSPTCSSKLQRWRTQANKTVGDENRLEDSSSGYNCDRVGDFPQNQTVHIFIFAHRSIPTGHQYAKPRPAASVYSRLQERSLNQTNFSKREIISPLIPLCVRAKLSELHHRVDKSCSNTLQKLSTDSTNVDFEIAQLKHKKS